MLTSRIGLSFGLCVLTLASAGESNAQPADSNAGRAPTIRSVDAEPGPGPLMRCVELLPPPEFDHFVEAAPMPGHECDEVRGFRHFHPAPFPPFFPRLDERRLHDAPPGSFDPGPGGVLLYRPALGPHSLERFRLQIEAPPQLCQAGQPIPWHVSITVGGSSVLLQFEADRADASVPPTTIRLRPPPLPPEAASAPAR